MSYYRRKPLTTCIHETKRTVHLSDCWFSFNSNNIAPSFLAYCGTQVFSVSSFLVIWLFSELQHACRYPATLTISWLCVALTYVHGQVSCEIMTKSCNPFSLVHTYIEISCHISEKEIFIFFSFLLFLGGCGLQPHGLGKIHASSVHSEGIRLLFTGGLWKPLDHLSPFSNTAPRDQE